MDKTQLRPEFLVYVIDSERDTRDLISAGLKKGRFQVQTFPTAKEAFSQIPKSPPHIVFCAAHVSDFEGVAVVNRIREMSSDIEVIYMCGREEKSLGTRALGLGAFDVLEIPIENISEILNVADRALGYIYLKLENEQLREELENYKARELKTDENLARQKSAEPFSLSSYLEKLSKFTDPKPILQEMVDRLSQCARNRPALFFRYSPAHSVLSVLAASQIPWDDVKHVGISLQKYDPKNITQILKEPHSFPELHEMMVQVFKCASYTSFAVTVSESSGLVVLFDTLDESEQGPCHDLIQGGILAYENLQARARLSEMAVRDPQTGLFNRKFFNEKLDEEMNRSRRTRYPLSLVYIDIDHLKKYNDLNGHAMGDVIIRAVAQILLKSSRKTDIPVRLGGEEFAILCPHTPAVGAAVKAEKIRLTIESTKFPNGEKQPYGHLTISVGVSEYPSIAGDGQILMRSADDALYRVKQGGRNRVCLAEAPRGFKPDFEALAVPGFQSLPPNASSTQPDM